MYLTLASHQPEYREYLENAAAAPSRARETFLYMRSYGPWSIDPRYLQDLMITVSAFLLFVSTA
jgi:hypothetical protein